MQTQRAKSSFWNKLVAWAEMLESASSDYPRSQLAKLSMDLDAVNHRLRVIESGETTRHEGSRS